MIAFNGAIYIFAPNWVWLLLAKSVEAVLTGLRNPAFSALLADSTTAGNRARSYALWNAVPISFGLFSPYLIGLLMDKYGIVEAQRWAYVVLIIVITVSGIIRNRYVEETLRSDSNARLKLSEVIRGTLKNMRETLKKMPRQLWVLLTLGGVYQFAVSLVSVFLVPLEMLTGTSPVDPARVIDSALTLMAPRTAFDVLSAEEAKASPDFASCHVSAGSDHSADSATSESVCADVACASLEVSTAIIPAACALAERTADQKPLGAFFVGVVTKLTDRAPLGGCTSRPSLSRTHGVVSRVASAAPTVDVASVTASSRSIRSTTGCEFADVPSRSSVCDSVADASPDSSPRLARASMTRAVIDESAAR